MPIQPVYATFQPVPASYMIFISCIFLNSFNSAGMKTVKKCLVFFSWTIIMLGSCSSDPTTNSETTNPECSRVFLTSPNVSNEKNNIKCSYVGQTSRKFRLMVSELVVGSGGQDIIFWQEKWKNKLFRNTYLLTHCTAVPNCQTWCKSAQAGNYYSEAQTQAKVSFLEDCWTLIGMSYESKKNAHL